MTLQFPANPTNGQTYTDPNGMEWVYADPPGAWGPNSPAFVPDLYVLRAGDTMTGSLSVAPSGDGAIFLKSTTADDNSMALRWTNDDLITWNLRGKRASSPNEPLDLALARYDGGGVFIEDLVTFRHATGNVDWKARQITVDTSNPADFVDLLIGGGEDGVGGGSALILRNGAGERKWALFNNGTSGLFQILRYVGGVSQGAAFQINEADGNITFTSGTFVVNAGGVAQLNSVGIPVIRNTTGSNCARLRNNNSDTLLVGMNGSYCTLTPEVNGSAQFRLEGSGGLNANQSVGRREQMDGRYQQTSSQRYKEQIGELSRTPSGDIIDAMPEPKTFVWGGEVPEEDERRGERAFGYIAEEVLTVFPEAIRYQWVDEAGGAKQVNGLDPMTLIATLMEEVKSLRQRVHDLEAMIVP